jgi:predicted porin
MLFKKDTLALAVFAAGAAWTAAAPALAQTSVQLYGSVDAGLSRVSNERGSGNTRVDSGNRSPDRFGFRGTENLGNGLQALFTVESGFNVDDGTLKKSTTIFNRRAVVGLSGGFGTVTLGHMPDFLYDYLRFQSNGIMGSSYFFHPGNLDNQASTFQIDNALRYETPVYHGFKLGAMIGVGENPDDSRKNRSWSAGAQYAAGPLKANLAYTVSNDRSFNLGGTLGIRSLLGQTLSAGDPAAPNAAYTNFASATTTSVGATASYTVGRFTPHAMFSRIELENRVGSAAQSNYEFGTDIDTGGANVLGISGASSRFAGVRWNQFNVIDMLHLSKRTTLYAALAYQRASNGLAVINGLNPSTTNRQIVSRIGIHHFF